MIIARCISRKSKIIMNRFVTNMVSQYIYRVHATRDDLQVEILRKSIHILIALVPILASLNISITLIMLGTGIVLYTFSETLRQSFGMVSFISVLTVAASRERDRSKFVLGPVTLGLGAMTALLFYPEPAATIAIFALAFGDSISSIVGKMFGSVKIPFLRGKTIAGSLACMVVVSAITYWITGLPQVSVLIGVAAMIFEAIPTGDMDNILIPIGTGFVTYLLIG